MPTPTVVLVHGAFADAASFAAVVPTLLDDGLSVIVPAGVGVRDGILALLLGALMPFPAAFTIVVVSRFFSVVADVVVAAVGWTWARSHLLLGSRS